MDYAEELRKAIKGLLMAPKDNDIPANIRINGVIKKVSEEMSALKKTISEQEAKLKCEECEGQKDLVCFKCSNMTLDTEFEKKISALEKKVSAMERALNEIKQEPDDICGGCNLKGSIAKRALAALDAGEGK